MRHKGIGIAAILIFSYFPLFLHLDSLPIQTYDESRLAINALEMSENGNFLVTYFDGKPDMWNTKPPLMIWLQVLCCKIAGYNELAVRLPAALAALATVFFLGFFCWKQLKRPILGITSMGVLLTTSGYIRTHVSRTGDYDALLILFMVLFLFSFFRFVHSDQTKERRRLLFLTALWLALATLTKGVAGLLFVPAAFMYLLLKKQGLTVLKSRDTYLAGGLFLSLVLGYYFLREHYNPGYLKAVWENELGGRYFETIENHKAPFFYYIKNLWYERFIPWLVLLPVGLIAGFYEKGIVRDFFQFLLIAIFSYLLIISFSNTKLQWYDAPLFPLLAVVTGLGVEKIIEFLNNRFKFHQSLFILILFSLPYFKTIKSVYAVSDSNPEHRYGPFMKEMSEYKEYTIAHVSYGAHFLFYQKAFNLDGYNIKNTWPSGLAEGETAMFCEDEPKRVLNEKYSFEVLEESRDCLLVKIVKRKD